MKLQKCSACRTGYLDMWPLVASGGGNWDFIFIFQPIVSYVCVGGGGIIQVWVFLFNRNSNFVLFNGIFKVLGNQICSIAAIEIMKLLIKILRYIGEARSTANRKISPTHCKVQK